MVVAGAEAANGERKRVAAAASDSSSSSARQRRRGMRSRFIEDGERKRDRG